MIAEFERIIASGAGPTIGQERYDGAYNMKEAADDGESLVKSIVNYTEHAAAAKSKVSNQEIRIYQLEMGGLLMLAPQQKKMANYMPEAAYLAPAPASMPVPPPRTVQPPQPPQQWTLHQTQQDYQPKKRGK